MGLSGFFYPLCVPLFYLPQPLAQRNKSSKPVCGRAWSAPSPSLSSSVSCSSQPIRCCGAAWNRSRGSFQPWFPSKGFIIVKDIFLKKGQNTDNHTSEKQVDRWLESNWSRWGHETCLVLTNWQFQEQKDLTYKDTGMCLWWGANDTYQPPQNHPEYPLAMRIEQSYIQFGGSYREKCSDCPVLYLSSVPCGSV